MAAPSTVTRPVHLPPGVRHRLRALGASPSHVGRPCNSARRGALPKTQDQLVDFLVDNSQELLAGGRKGAELLGEAVGSYIRAQRNDPGLQELDERVQAGIDDFLRQQGQVGRLPLGGPEPSRSVKSALNNPRPIGATVDGLFNDMSELLLAVRPGNTQAPTEKLRLLENALGSAVGSDGGFLVPEQLRSQLLAVSLETSIVRHRATVIPHGHAAGARPDRRRDQQRQFGVRRRRLLGGRGRDADAVGAELRADGARGQEAHGVLEWSRTSSGRTRLSPCRSSST